MDKSNYIINSNYTFLNWYNSMVEYGYSGYTTNELQQFIDAITLFYVGKEENVKIKNAINLLPANDYRFLSCYYRKNKDYNIDKSSDNDSKKPRQDTVKMTCFKTKGTFTIYYDEAGTFYNIYDDRKKKFLFDSQEKDKETLQEVYIGLKPYADRLDLSELESVMFTHSVDLELRERLAFMISDKIADIGGVGLAEQFRKDASKYFGVKFDKTQHNTMENAKTVFSYKVKCKQLQDKINLCVK